MGCIFQSTPSVGRATIKAGIMQSANGISIHALRGEGDNPHECRLLVEQRFQSTPSVGRATGQK